jgi:phenylacetate-CoA ligase
MHGRAMNFRLRDFVLYPLAIKRFHDLLLQSQFWSRDRLRSWTQERLDRNLRLAVRTVPYYRRTLGPYASRFTECVDRLDLSELPSITKDTVRQYGPELRADSSALTHSVVRTSGTTGTPTEFLVDGPSNIAQFASLWRVLNWAGYSFGDRFVDIRRNPSQGPLLRRDRRLNALVIPVFHFQRENVPLYLEHLRRFDPVLIKSYPSAIDLFCRWLRELGLEYRPRALLTCAETLLDHQRAVIQEVLRCPMFDFYNHNERAGLISTCDAGTYHIHEEYSWMELIGEDGRPARPGAAGEVVTTSFHNDVMPLIRYRTGDLATRGEGPCGCGRNHRTVSRINGRITDVIVTPDGRHLGGLEHAFMRAGGVHRSQIVQETVEEIVVNIVKAPSYTPADSEQIEHGLRSFLGDEMRIRFNYVDAIQPGENGKVQFVVSKPGRAARLPLSSVGG